MSHRIFRLLPLTLVASLAACNADLTSPSATFERARTDASSNGALTETQTARIAIPAGTTQFLPCVNGGDGEVVDVSGATMLLMHQNVSTVSGNANINLQWKSDGVRMVGQSTGVVYRSSTSQQLHVTLSEPDLSGVRTATLDLKAQVTGQGIGRAAYAYVRLHVTQSANGETRASVEKTRMSCDELINPFLPF
jgi:hypothetical protein